MKQIERISHMEQLFDFATTAIKKLPVDPEEYGKLQDAIASLAEYYDSDEWRKDYEDDESGLLPRDLKRGVLSEDGIWNLLAEWQEIP